MKLKRELHEVGFNIRALNELKFRIGSKDKPVLTEHEEISQEAWKATRWGIQPTPKTNMFIYFDWDDPHNEAPASLLPYISFERKRNDNVKSGHGIVKIINAASKHELADIAKNWSIPDKFEIFQQDHKPQTLAVMGEYIIKDKHGGGSSAWVQTGSAITEMPLEALYGILQDVKAMQPEPKTETVVPGGVNRPGIDIDHIPESGAANNQYVSTAFKMQAAGASKEETLKYLLFINNRRPEKGAPIHPEHEIEQCVESAAKKIKDLRARGLMDEPALKGHVPAGEQEHLKVWLGLHIGDYVSKYKASILKKRGHTKYQKTLDSVITAILNGMESKDVVPDFARYKVGGAGHTQLVDLIKWTIENRLKGKNIVIKELASNTIKDLAIKVVRDNGEFLVWCGAHYAGTAENSELMIRAHVQKYDQDITTTTINEVIHRIERTDSIHVDRRHIDIEPGLAFKNGYLQEDGSLVEHLPDRLNRVYVDYDFMPVKMRDLGEVDEYTLDDIANVNIGDGGIFGETRYWKSLNLSLRGDLEKIYTWFESLAYSMGKDSKMQKMVLHIGRGDNGKSKFLEHWRQILGNCSSEPIHALAGNRFRPAGLYGKLCNIFADIESKEMNEGMPMLKSLIAGDMVTAEHKGHKPFQFQNHATQMYSCNTVPVVKDQSDGWFRRQLIIEWDYQLNPSEIDPVLPDKIANDVTANSALFGILWHIRRRLYNRGRFRFARPTNEIRKLWNKKADHITAFREECLRDVKGETLLKRTVFDVYRAWCDSMGVPAYGINGLGRQLGEVYYEKFSYEWDEVDKDKNDENETTKYEKKRARTWLDVALTSKGRELQKAIQTTDKTYLE